MALQLTCLVFDSNESAGREGNTGISAVWRISKMDLSEVRNLQGGETCEFSGAAVISRKSNCSVRRIKGDFKIEHISNYQ